MSSLKSIREFIDKHGGPMRRPMKLAKNPIPYRHKLMPDFHVSFDLDKKYNKFNILNSSPLLTRLIENINLICGDNIYEVNKFVVNSLIPDFRELLSKGYNLTSYTIDANSLKFDDPSDINHPISLFANILACKSITLTIDNANELLKISESLHVDSLTTFLLTYLQNAYNNIENLNKLSNKISKYNSLLLLLLDLSKDNYESTLLSFFNSDFFKTDKNSENLDENDIKNSFFLNLIEISSNARPYSNELLATFCKEITKDLKKIDLFEEMSFSNLFFIYQLYINNLINKEKLLKSITQDTPELFCWFSPELKEFNNEEYLKLHKHFKLAFNQYDKKPKRKKQIFEPKNEQKNDICSTFKDFILNFEKFYADDWKILKEMRESGANQTEIATIIRNDDLNGLQDILQNENYEQTIIPTIFERCNFLKSRRPFLIEYAAFFGSVDCFKFLISNTNKIHDSLIYAVAGGCIEIIRICENSDASVITGIPASIQFSRNSIFEWILDSFDDSTSISSKKLFENGTFLLDLDSSLGYTELSFKYGNIFSLKTLIERGFDISQQCLIFASKSGNLLLAKIFYSLGLKPEDSDCLFFAVENGHATVLNYILTQSIEAFKQMSMPNLLFNAIKMGHAKVLELLIESGLFDINSTEVYINKDNTFALPLATTTTTTNSNGANNEEEEDYNNNNNNNNNDDDDEYGDYSDDDDDENEVVFIGKMKKEKKSVEESDLLRFFAPSVTAVEDRNSETPLIAAARCGNLDVLRVILKKKDLINLNAVNKDGMTALMVATEGANIEAVKELVSLKEVDLNVAKGNLTAERIANNKGLIKISAILTKEKRNRARMNH